MIYASKGMLLDKVLCDVIPCVCPLIDFRIYYINLSYKHFLNSFFMHKIYLCQAFMHLWVQQGAEAFKF